VIVPPWLALPLERLDRARLEGRLPHALLIHGPPGWGAVALADMLAMSLLGRAPDPDQHAWDLAHTDLRWVQPEGPGGQIRIDEVRELAEFATGTAQMGDLKVAVLERADRLNAHAANALLKTLEEPPGATHIILATEALERLLPTLRSRCQRVTIAAADASQAMAWMTNERSDANPKVIKALAFEYGHAPFAVLDALDREVEPLVATLEALSAGSIDPLTVAESLAKQDLDDIVSRWMRHVSARLRDQPGGGGRRSDALLGFWRELEWVRRLIKGGTNPNARLILEGLCCAWRDLRHESHR
jgi:DNA polymerase-3 subunit delta'